MNRKRGNILSLILSLVLSCAIIPIGIMKDWGIMEYLLCCATLFISGLIVGWNNKAAFRIKGGADYHLGYNTIGFFCFVFGGQGLGEVWGEALLLKCLSAALVITGAIFIRRACSTRSDTKEQVPIHLIQRFIMATGYFIFYSLYLILAISWLLHSICRGQTTLIILTSILVVCLVVCIIGQFYANRRGRKSKGDK